MRISAPQHVFLNVLKTKFTAYVGGYGSGKTFVACLRLLIFALRHPGYVQSYYAPTFALVRDVFYPVFLEAAELMGVKLTFSYNNAEVAMYRNGAYYGTIICMSMHKPSAIVGFKCVNSIVDEIDTLRMVIAKEAWKNILARMRIKVDGVMNTLGAVTTPEGHHFMFEMFADDPTSSYSMVQASTQENSLYLPDDYISSLEETYTKEQVRAYIKGLFVNMRNGTVYVEYDKELNHTDRVILPHDVLHIGMDFNVGKMAAVAHVIDDGAPLAVDEFIGLRDTPKMIEAIDGRYPNHDVIIYPDATGKGRNTVNALKTNFSLLEDAGYVVDAMAANPEIPNRVGSMNAMFCNAKGERRYKVNRRTCPKYAGTLTKQAYDDNGDPDKKAGHDHPNDGGGYFIHNRYPAIKPLLVDMRRVR